MGRWWRRTLSRDDGVDRASWQHAVGGDATWSFGAADGLRVLRAGSARGRLLGGCISILAEALGTPYARCRRCDEPCVLFLEDIGTKPYQWDRMLLHLRYAGMLEDVKWDCASAIWRSALQPEEMELLEQAILHALRDFDGPIAIGLRCGHVDRANITLPLGVWVRLDLRDAENPRMEFLEAAVAVIVCSEQNAKHIHLIGICGTAMASLAGMLQRAGTSRDGLGCGGLSADERSAGATGDSDHGAVCGEESGAAAGSGGGGQCDLARQRGAGVCAG